MRYPASEKLEIIRIDEQSHLPAKRTLFQIGVARRTFYRKYDRDIEGGPEALADQPLAPNKVRLSILLIDSAFFTMVVKAYQKRLLYKDDIRVWDMNLAT